MSLSILRATLSLPTAPFHEQAVAAHVRAFALARKLPVRADRFGNLIVRCQRSRAQAIAFAAHMDHPGFEVVEVNGVAATLQSYGDTRGKNAVGAKIRAQTAHGEVTGVIESVAEQRAMARFAGTVAVGDFAQWDFPAYQLRGKRIYSRAIDDVAGCAALLAALDELSRTKTAVNLYAIFTRAEEVGFAGATALASGNVLPKSVPVVSIETSKALRGAEQGKGYVVRLGDRASMFDPALTQFLLKVARELKVVPFQQRLMEGGTCEATAFNVLGYTASGVCVPLCNYHNQGDRDIAPEYIHADDFTGLVRFIVAACERAGELRALQPLLRKRVLKLLQLHRKKLLETAGEIG